MKKKLLSALLVLIFTPSLVFAARPSINELNTRVNKLEADVNQLDSRVTTNESDINANSTLIDDNTNRINALRPSISVRANGSRIGAYVNTIGIGSSPPRPSHITVMNDSEYLFQICLVSGECSEKNEGDLLYSLSGSSGRVAYTTIDCTDQGYYWESDLEVVPGLGGLLKGSGYVFDNGGSIYYLPSNSAPVRDQFKAWISMSGGDCVTSGVIGTQTLYPIFPNNPSVTGVSTSTFELPLSLGF